MDSLMPLDHFQVDDFALKKASQENHYQEKKLANPSQLKISFVVSLICKHDTKQICSDLGSILF